MNRPMHCSIQTMSSVGICIEDLQVNSVKKEELAPAHGYLFLFFGAPTWSVLQLQRASVA